MTNREEAAGRWRDGGPLPWEQMSRKRPGMGVAQVARAAGLNRLRLSHAGFAWPQRLAT